MAAMMPTGRVGDPAPIIALRDVRKHYTLGDHPVEALRGVSATIQAGEFVVILGPSGSGKSTLLQLIGAMDRPSGGQVLFDGRDISRLSKGEQRELRLRRIGFVFQTFNLIPTLTALENVALPLRLAGAARPTRRARARALLERVGLSEWADHLPRQLSGGQRQRVAIARALANDPDLILADEPTGNLDSDAGAAVMALLDGLHREGRTVVTVTHNNEYVRYADRVLHLRDGRLAERTRAA